ncbi:MAG: hypothetical protein ACJ8KU_00300, partial [Chthoniobacterales bacterium]
MNPTPRTRTIRRGSLVAVGLTGAIAAAVLTGWATSNDRLRAFVPGLPVMNPVTAVCLLALGGALVLLLPDDATKARRSVGHLLAGLVLCVGIARFIVLARGWHVPV